MNNVNEKETHLRVTEIIKPFTGVEFVPIEILDRAAQRGTDVHTEIENEINGFPFPSISEETAPYVESFRKFWKKGDDSVIDHPLEETLLQGKESEIRLFCNRLGISGQIDLIIKHDDKTYLYDWKTSSRKHKSWRLQAAAYKYLAEQNGYPNVQPLHMVKLSKAGRKPTVYSFDTYLEDLDVFFKCLDLYKWFEMHKTRRQTTNLENIYEN